MHDQTAFQYWGAGLAVIPLAASDYRLPQVPGHRTNPASKPQAPNQRGGAPIWSDMSDKSDRSDMSDQAPHQTSGTIRPLHSTGGLGYQSYLWLRVITAHLKCRGGAPIKSDKTDRSDMSDQAPHQTLRQNQTVIQYWGAGLAVIPLAARDYRSPQVPGHRTNPASKPQAPNQRRRRTN